MYRDTPARYVADLFEELLYGDQPAGWDIGGKKETILKLQGQNFVDYFNTHYIAQNTVVVVAGNIDSEHIKGKTEEYFKDIRRGKQITKPAVVEKQSAPQIKIFYKDTDQTHMILGTRAYNMFDDRKYALGVLSNILGGGMSSRLFDEIRQKRGLAYYVHAGSQVYTDSGFFIVKAGINNEKAEEAGEVILEELRKVRERGITDQELQKAKDHTEGRMALGLEHSDAVAGAYAEPVLFEGKVLTPEEELCKIKEVTLDQVLQVAKDIFQNDKLNLALIGPFKEGELFKKILKI
jgi:predicted Zn-dependent peptidase